MSKDYSVTLDLIVKSVSCPGVWLCPKGVASLSFKTLGKKCQTGATAPIFPLTFNSSFNFKKDFKGVSSLTSLHNSLANETVYCELQQWPHTFNEGKARILATYVGVLEDLLFPPEVCSDSQLDLLMKPASIFPGIIAPKIEINKTSKINPSGNGTKSDTKENNRSSKVQNKNNYNAGSRQSALSRTQRTQFTEDIQLPLSSVPQQKKNNSCVEESNVPVSSKLQKRISALRKPDRSIKDHNNYFEKESNKNVENFGPSKFYHTQERSRSLVVKDHNELSRQEQNINTINVGSVGRKSRQERPKTSLAKDTVQNNSNKERSAKEPDRSSIRHRQPINTSNNEFDKNKSSQAQKRNSLLEETDRSIQFNAQEKSDKTNDLPITKQRNSSSVKYNKSSAFYNVCGCGRGILAKRQKPVCHSPRQIRCACRSISVPPFITNESVNASLFNDDHKFILERSGSCWNSRCKSKSRNLQNYRNPSHSLHNDCDVCYVYDTTFEYFPETIFHMKI